MKKEVYVKYFKAGGSWLIYCSILFMFIVAQFICSANDYWTMYWTRAEDLRRKVASNLTTSSAPMKDHFLCQLGELGLDKYGLPLTSTFVYVNTLFIFLVVIFSFVKCFLFVTINLKASRRLHNQMFQAVLRTNMNFFHNNPSGD